MNSFRGCPLLRGFGLLAVSVRFFDEISWSPVRRLLTYRFCYSGIISHSSSPVNHLPSLMNPGLHHLDQRQLCKPRCASQTQTLLS
ncbi:hypothetical protein PROFUN_01315 [Planoprotostelium fungivorum]|uniref:Uncharacterized protein n=1 Tax=Planoprotostelium fungivorum TaxID=1890364 RepID=A0A2P6NZS6_9EUKA|nr:hypothetical protein PROFUN_01315 [Planoprotostelium fungivorum]